MDRSKGKDGKPTVAAIRDGHVCDCTCKIIDWRTPHCRNHSPEAGPHWELHRVLAALDAAESKASAATARAAGLEQALRAIEWDPNTTPNQCAWCMYGRAVGHADDCAFARVLALAALAPAAGEGEHDG